MNKSSMILIMSLICIIGLVYIGWSVSGVNVNYLGEELVVSTPRCMRTMRGLNIFTM